MARSPKEGFPVFQDGDVEICLSRKPEDRFVLHSFVLGLHSPFFKVSISERWSGRNDDATSDDDAAPGDPIKWRYQLLFEEDMDDEGASLLAKALLITTRFTLIRAHRHYLETLYHKPLKPATNTFSGSVNTLVRVLRLADAYGSLAVFQMPVDTAFARVKSDLDRFCGKYYFKIIYIAMLARSAWLFQYVICRLVGNPTWADEKIRKTFDTLGIIPLVLEKRSQLRETMLRLDHTIMLAGVPVDNLGSVIYGHTIALATAAYKLHLLQHIEEYDRGGWELSSRKYRTLKDPQGPWPTWRYDKLLNMFGPIKVNKSDFNGVIDDLRTEVADLVSPLLVDHLDKDWTMPDPDNWKRKHHGLTCVRITNDDPPWKDNPW